MISNQDLQTPQRQYCLLRLHQVPLGSVFVLIRWELLANYATPKRGKGAVNKSSQNNNNCQNYLVLIIDVSPSMLGQTP